MTTSRSQHGGKRTGAGRKKGTGHYNESTKALRIPISLLPAVQESLKNYNLQLGKGLSSLASPNLELIPYALPLYSHHISAGFPSPADDHVDGKLDLNHYLIPHPTTTFFIRVTGDSMIDAHITEGDLLTVDRSLVPKHNDIVIAVVDGELTVKRLIQTKERLALKPENPAYPLIEINDPDRLFIWGVVTHTIE